MATNYKESIDEMLKFIEDYDIYLYSVLYRYAATYNWNWKCALRSKIGSTIMRSATKTRLLEKKAKGKLTEYDPMKQFEEYDKLIALLPEEMLIEIPMCISVDTEEM